MNEETKQNWMRIGLVALITFIVAYLAFYASLKHHLKNINNPFYQAEKMLSKEERNFDKYDRMNNPFEPKIRPMMVNLVKEANEYKVIIDLNQLDGDESAVNVFVQGDELTIKGQLDKKVRNTEKIINFTQTYYLDEKIDENGITKKRKGDKYIVTIPFLNNIEEEMDD